MHLQERGMQAVSGTATGGQGVRQTPPEPGAPVGDTRRIPKVSPISFNQKALLTFAEAGQLLGICERKAHDVVPTLVDVRVLGPRCVRIVRAELEAAVANLPRRAAPAEPHQLLRGKVEKLKRAAVPA